MWLSGVIAITNSHNESASPWKMDLWIFTSAQAFYPAVNSTFQFYVASIMNLMTLLDIIYIFRQSTIQL